MKLYKGNVGTEIKLNIGKDITAATSLKIEALKPDDTVVVWDGAVTETTKVMHTVAVGELDMKGDWILQAKVSFGTDVFYSEAVRMTVHERWM